MNRRDPSPADRVKASGIRAASVIDLIAVGFSRNEDDVILAENMARGLLSRFGSIRSLGEASSSDLLTVTGLEGHELLRTQALLELGRRIAMAGKGPQRVIDAPEDVVKVLDEQMERFRGEKREHFFAILLDTKGAVMRVAEIHVGTLNMSIVGAREIFREAIREGASGVILGHNHPSGDPTPSHEDIDVTSQLVKLGEMLDIRVEDHVILGEDGFTSLRREKLM